MLVILSADGKLLRTLLWDAPIATVRCLRFNTCLPTHDVHYNETLSLFPPFFRYCVLMQCVKSS